MKALSIRQPWAWLIVNGYKDVENRTWPWPKTVPLPARIYVHAGLQHDRRAFDITWTPSKELLYRLPGRAALDHWLATAYSTYPSLPGFPAGAIVGEVTVGMCVAESRSSWFEGPYGFTLTRPIAYDVPISYKGRLGVFDVKLPETT